MHACVFSSRGGRFSQRPLSPRPVPKGPQGGVTILPSPGLPLHGGIHQQRGGPRVPPQTLHAHPERQEALRQHPAVGCPPLHPLLQQRHLPSRCACVRVRVSVCVRGCLGQKGCVCARVCVRLVCAEMHVRACLSGEWGVGYEEGVDCKGACACQAPPPAFIDADHSCMHHPALQCGKPPSGWHCHAC